MFDEMPANLGDSSSWDAKAIPLPDANNSPYMDRTQVNRCSIFFINQLQTI